MIALILAAGFGRRMQPLTDKQHKTLLKIGNLTVIERIINGLLENNIEDIVIVTGYFAKELKYFLINHYPQIKFQFVHNKRYEDTNNIYSMALAFESIDIDDDILLIESDLVFESKVIKRLLHTKHSNVALVDKYKSGMDGTVVNIIDGVITEVIPPHLQHDKFDFSDKYKTLNIYKFSKEFCNSEFKKLLTYYAKVIDHNCYYELILGILIYMKRETIYAEILNGEKWAEIDDPNDLRIAKFIFNNSDKLEIIKESFGGYWNHDILDFCFIRNMYFPNSSIFSEMRNNLPGLIQNYGSKQSILNEKLSYFLKVKKERINILNGASQIYPILKEYLNNKKILIPNPTYGEYPRNFPESYNYSDKVGVDLKVLIKRAENIDVLVIVNPNNPTGSEISTDWIYKYAMKNSNKLIIVDESFIEFSKNGSIINKLENKSLKNIIVLKSLSKSLGIPGLRLGFVYSCNQQLNKYVQNNVPIWNINSVAEYFLEIILKHRIELDMSIEKTKLDREEFACALSKLNFVNKVYPSGSNFLLIMMKKELNGKKIVENLLQKYSIYIKDISDKFSDGKTYIRLAVRLPEENRYLLKCLSDCLVSSN